MLASEWENQAWKQEWEVMAGMETIVDIQVYGPRLDLGSSHFHFCLVGLIYSTRKTIKTTFLNRSLFLWSADCERIGCQEHNHNVLVRVLANLTISPMRKLTHMSKHPYTHSHDVFNSSLAFKHTRDSQATQVHVPTAVYALVIE